MPTTKEAPYLQLLRRRLKHAQQCPSKHKYIEDIQRQIETWTNAPQADINFFKYTPNN